MLMNPFTLPAMALAPAGRFVRQLNLPQQSSTWAQWSRSVAGLPFDTARAQYAWAVQAGLVKRSLLASRDFERSLGALEQLTCGALARQV